jgi:hypothetical protein
MAAGLKQGAAYGVSDKSGGTGDKGNGHGATLLGSSLKIKSPQYKDRKMGRRGKIFSGRNG